MPQDFTPANDRPITAQPVPAGPSASTGRTNDPLDAPPQEDAAALARKSKEEQLDQMASGLYSLASMLVGEGEQSIQLVETAVTNAEVSICSDPAAACKSSRRVLVTAALGIIKQRNFHHLAAPVEVIPTSGCIDRDDLEAAGVPREEFERLIDEPGRERLRTWLESLPVRLRTVFVLRAVAGFSAAETAEMLAAQDVPRPVVWSPEAVRELFRQGLCSLASQLIHSTVAR